jgi:lipopolysaccharide transport system ATP-binding protein
MSGVSSAWSRVRGGEARDGRAEIWALDDVTFDVKEGEVLGIIGRNGAGKSTLLKILSRITRPTSGYADIHGRLGSLLEVGTGFHPELTGRDNIFLNGAILGMHRSEIAGRFDEIVSFSGIEKFLDTPVKRYSSGMYMRLAFSVAAHLDPDILLVDEVLAVGDAEFQKKCLGKMESVVKQGRTVLFVSHNMAAVKSLCGRALLLDAGRVTADGQVDQVVDRYLSFSRTPQSDAQIPSHALRSGTGEARYRRVEILTVAGEPVSELYFGQRFRVRMTLEVVKPTGPVVAGIVVAALDGTEVACAFSTDRGAGAYAFTPGWYTVEVELDIALVFRTYSLVLTLNRTDGYDVDWVQQTISFNVLNVAETGTDAYPWGALHGYVRAQSMWRTPEPIQ